MTLAEYVLESELPTDDDAVEDVEIDEDVEVEETEVDDLTDVDDADTVESDLPEELPEKGIADNPEVDG